MITLIINYEKVSNKVFNSELYQKVLTTTIAEFVKEDIKSHSCLLVLKGALSEVSDNKRIEPVAMAFMYANDFALHRRIQNTTITMSLL